MRRDSTMAVSLGWVPEDKRKPGRLKETWTQVGAKQLKQTGVNTWNEAAEIAKNERRGKRRESCCCYMPPGT